MQRSIIGAICLLQIYIYIFIDVAPFTKLFIKIPGILCRAFALMDVVQLLRRWYGCRHWDDNENDLITAGTAPSQHRTQATSLHGQPDAQADALQVLWREFTTCTSLQIKFLNRVYFVWLLCLSNLNSYIYLFSWTLHFDWNFGKGWV